MSCPCLATIDPKKIALIDSAAVVGAKRSVKGLSTQRQAFDSSPEGELGLPLGLNLKLIKKSFAEQEPLDSPPGQLQPETNVGPFLQEPIHAHSQFGDN